MNSIYVDQVGYLLGSRKRAVLNFKADAFELVNESGETVYHGKVSHFGTDDISGEDVSVAAFDDFNNEGIYKVKSGNVSSVAFSVSDRVYDGLLRDLCKCFYYLRCGDALDEKYAGAYYHKSCHTAKATVFGEDTEPVDVGGGWHDAGDYGRYSTAGAVAVAHLLYGVRFFDGLLDIRFDIPPVSCEGGQLPDILAEVKVELDFLMKMQRDDGSVWHKVTTYNHAGFIMPEEDTEELFLFPVSSMATADIAAAFALAYTVYGKYDKAYAGRLLEAALKAYKWLEDNPKPRLFKNEHDSNTGEYGEQEDISNRFWAACSLYEATGDDRYYSDAGTYAGRLIEYDANSKDRGYQGDVFTNLGWGNVGGLGAMALMLNKGDDPLTGDMINRYIKEADRLCASADRNGFCLCMEKGDFIWGSNMELLKYLMILTVAGLYNKDKRYYDVILSGVDYLLGCNSMDTSYVTGNGEKAYRKPHLRPTACDGIDEPWPGLVAGGPNKDLQDEKAMKEIPDGVAPMKCYVDHEDCYSLNEITIYWNSTFVFVLAGL